MDLVYTSRHYLYLPNSPPQVLPAQPNYFNDDAILVTCFFFADHFSSPHHLKQNIVTQNKDMPNNEMQNDLPNNVLQNDVPNNDLQNDMPNNDLQNNDSSHQLDNHAQHVKVVGPVEAVPIRKGKTRALCNRSKTNSMESAQHLDVRRRNAICR